MLSPLRCNDSLCTRIPERWEYDICSIDIDAGVGRIQNTGCGVVSEAAEQEDVVDVAHGGRHLEHALDAMIERLQVDVCGKQLAGYRAHR